MRPSSILVAALLTGCASPAEPATSMDNRDSVTSGTDQAEEAPVGIMREERLAWDGTIPSWGYVCVWTVSRCVTTPYPEVSPQEHLLPLANFTHAKLTLTWNPTGPTTRELRLILLNVTTKEDGAQEWNVMVEAQPGASPVVLDAELPPMGEGVGVVVFVGGLALDQPAGETAGGSYYSEQPFHVEGTLLVNETAEES